MAKKPMTLAQFEKTSQDKAADRAALAKINKKRSKGKAKKKDR